MHGFRPLLGAAVAVALAAHLAAQNAPQTPAGQYTRADIEAGARIYAQCVGCHGVNGDQIANVDLRRGQFPTVVSDADLVRLMATGKPAVGMPPFTVLRTDEGTTLGAYIRSGFDAAGGAADGGPPRRGGGAFFGEGGGPTGPRAHRRGSRRAPEHPRI